MATLITDPDLEQQVRATRSEWGGDRYDEVWEGTYIMAPMPNNEHQWLATRLAGVLDAIIGGTGYVFAGANVSDREVDWRENYRVPDVVVTLKGGRARDCGTHFFGGPDFLIEIVSKGDESRSKFSFYAKIGVRELLIIDRDPWSVELYRLVGEHMESVGQTQVDTSTGLASSVLPITFRLLAGQPRPQIEIIHRDGQPRWVV